MKYTMTDTNTPGPLRIESIRVRWIPDDSDPDWLMQDYADVPDPSERAKYREEDRKRRQAFHNGEWHLQGCVAKAIVSYPISGNSRRLQEFQSGGLWGIESDSDESFLRETERDQIEDLRHHLEQFGVPWDASKIPGATAG